MAKASPLPNSGTKRRPNMADDTLLIERFQDSAQAVMLRDLLRGSGFTATVQGQSGVGGSGARIIGGFLVVVPRGEHAEAISFLATLAQAEAIEQEADWGANEHPEGIAPQGSVLDAVKRWFRGSSGNPT